MAHRDIIVIGASAGGIGALQTILPALPWNFHASLFVVIHTSEESPALLPDILNRASKIPVLYAVNNAAILPGRVYIAPGGRAHMTLQRGTVRLQPGPRENRSRPSIDALFRSASHAYGSQVIGVVLSGNLDDGTAGLADIKARGGLAIAQDPTEAIAPSMPASAIENTGVDFILPVEEIGPKLVELVAAERGEEVLAFPMEPSNGGDRRQVYSCPECGGVLEELENEQTLRFRCRVGHSYSPETLLAEQNLGVEKALWAAIRTLEEQAEFSDRLASNSQRKKRPRLASRFSEKAQTSRQNADVLRELLQRATDLVVRVAEESTGTE
jgi:two-component system chemotaxis response regulator CheB